MNVMPISVVNSGLKSVNYTNNKKVNFSGINYIGQDNPDIKDCTELYTHEEIVQILERLGVNTKMPFNYPANYSVQLYPDGAMVINNKSCTNDTTEIAPDGSAINVGSWHRRELAEKGSCNDILDELKNRVENQT